MKEVEGMRGGLLDQGVRWKISGGGATTKDTKGMGGMQEADGIRDEVMRR